MNYTFVMEDGNQKTVNIEDKWLIKQQNLLGITQKEAIEMWLSDEGYKINEVVEELTAKAKANKTGVKGAASSKPRKKPERKPDHTKRRLIDYLYECLTEDDLDLEICECPKDVQVTNVERVVTFSIKDDNYELTLSKKRKPKS